MDAMDPLLLAALSRSPDAFLYYFQHGRQLSPSALVQIVHRYTRDVSHTVGTSRYAFGWHEWCLSSALCSMLVDKPSMIWALAYLHSREYSIFGRSIIASSEYLDEYFVEQCEADVFVAILTCGTILGVFDETFAYLDESLDQLACGKKSLESVSIDTETQELLEDVSALVTGAHHSHLNLVAKLRSSNALNRELAFEVLLRYKKGALLLKPVEDVSKHGVTSLLTPFALNVCRFRYYRCCKASAMILVWALQRRKIPFMIVQMIAIFFLSYSGHSTFDIPTIPPLSFS